MNTKGNNTQIVTKTNQIFIQNIILSSFTTFRFIEIRRRELRETSLRVVFVRDEQLRSVESFNFRLWKIPRRQSTCSYRRESLLLAARLTGFPLGAPDYR